MPDLNLLVTLDVLLAEGSVARAAQRLRLSPSAMSRALTRLRETTGDPLLVRAGRGLVPTPRALELRAQVSRLVQEAWAVGQRAGIEPTLVLAVMAIESSFNPFAQSPVGAQGLMQVMTRVHDDKYQAFGGTRAAFDPVTNVRVGVQVLKECIAKAGGLEAGLRFYVGAAVSGQDGGYVVKVLAEQAHLRLVASGKPVSINAPLPSYRPVSPPDGPLSDEPSGAVVPTSTASVPAGPGASQRVAMLR